MYDAASAVFKLLANVIDEVAELAMLIRFGVVGVGLIEMIEYSIGGLHVLHVVSVAAVNGIIVVEDKIRLSMLLRAPRVRPAGSEHL